MENFYENAVEMFQHTVELVKFSLLVVSCQFGKTYLTIKHIQKHIKQDNDFITGPDGGYVMEDGKIATVGRSIHIIFTMNTILNNTQFAVRVKCIEDEYGVGSVCVVSSQYKGMYKHVRSEAEIRYLLRCDKKIRVIVMCTNVKRTRDGTSFIQNLNDDLTEMRTPLIKRVFVYYDEIHHYITSEKLRKGIELIHDLPIVKEIIGITATPLNVWTGDEGRWGRLNIYHLDDFNTENYIGFNDLEYEYQDDYFPEDYEPPSKADINGQKEQVLGFIDHCLEECEEILEKGNRVFIPAQVSIASHFAVRDHLLEIDSDVVVIVINGVEKSITYKASPSSTDLTSIDIVSRKGEELCDTVSRILISEDLLSKTLVYTGFLCISMGQTLVNSTIGSFTHAILCHIGLTNCEMYQLAGRLNGRMLNWETYKKTIVFCPTIIKDIVVEMEKCAFGIAALAQSAETKNVSREDYMEYMANNIRENNRKPKEPKPIKDTSKMRVPVIIENVDPSHPIFSMKKSLKREERVDMVLSILSRVEGDYEKLHSFISNENVVCGKISRITTAISYKKHIMNVAKAASKNKPYVVDIDKKQKDGNCWNLFIDDIEHRLCFVMWVIDDTLY